MNISLESFIAWRYLRSKKQERFISVVSLFSLVGTALGVAALIAVMSVMAGVREEWTNMLVGAVGDINVYPRGYSEIIDYKKITQKIKAYPQVTDVIPVIEKQALIATDHNNSGVQVRGISEKNLTKKSVITNKMVMGSLENFKNNGIIIGEALAHNLNLAVGDSVKLISPQTTSVVIGNIPRIKTCQIVGIFNSGTPDLDNLTVFMPLELAQVYFKIPEQVNLIEVNVSKVKDLNVFKNILEKDLKYEYRLVTWQQRNASLMNALQIEKMAMFMILTLIMIVAAFNIISGLIMLVKDKTSDIAILRTMGASRKMIIQIFLICGSSIGIIGTTLGVILGVSFAKNVENIRQFLESLTGVTIFDPLVYFLSFLPSKLHTDDVFAITCMSLSLSVVATIYPAYRAAKLDPAVVLK